ncbi:MAG TPA: DUF2809 domain-containing protein [Flavitalea sp.]|nr:DUF2809 domain-containing protein [Flavitalea sp.]
MIKLNRTYLVITIALFLVEIMIAVFLHDQYIRPYVGDFLVVILIYCFIRSFLNISVMTAAVFTLLFAYVIEVLQYFKLVELLGLENVTWARVVLGSSFEWIDIVAYTLGILVVLVIERNFSYRNNKTIRST